MSRVGMRLMGCVWAALRYLRSAMTGLSLSAVGEACGAYVSSGYSGLLFQLSMKVSYRQEQSYYLKYRRGERVCPGFLKSRGDWTRKWQDGMDVDGLVNVVVAVGADLHVPISR
jgi:hypothetical protein